MCSFIATKKLRIMEKLIPGLLGSSVRPKLLWIRVECSYKIFGWNCSRFYSSRIMSPKIENIMHRLRFSHVTRVSAAPAFNISHNSITCSLKLSIRTNMDPVSWWAYKQNPCIRLCYIFLPSYWVSLVIYYYS